MPFFPSSHSPSAILAHTPNPICFFIWRNSNLGYGPNTTIIGHSYWCIGITLFFPLLNQSAKGGKKKTQTDPTSPRSAQVFHSNRTAESGSLQPHRRMLPPLTFRPRPPGAPLQPGRVHLGDTSAAADSRPRPTEHSASRDPRRRGHLALPLGRRLLLHLGHEQARHLALHRAPAAHGPVDPIAPPAPRPAGSAPAPRWAMGDVVRLRPAGAPWQSEAASRGGRGCPAGTGHALGLRRKPLAVTSAADLARRPSLRLCAGMEAVSPRSGGFSVSGCAWGGTVASFRCPGSLRCQS